MNYNDLSKTKKILLIASLGIFLTLIIVSMVFSIKQNNQKKTLKSKAAEINQAPSLSFNWKTYQEQINEGSLAPVKNILEISLEYDKSKTPNVSIKNVVKKNGYAPKINVDRNKSDNIIEVLDSKGVIYT